MPSPSPYTAARSNPRRRPRTASEDSVAVRQPVKRRKRSALTQETFASLDAAQVNGTAKSYPRPSITNGVKHEDPDHETNGLDHTNLAFRDRINGNQSQEQGLSSQKQEHYTELTRNKNYTISRLTSTPSTLSTFADAETQWRVNFSPHTGHAVATTYNEAFVWRYNPSLSSPEQRPARVKFPHLNGRPHDPPAFAMIIPTSSEPSLLVVTPTNGKMTFWDSISNAASTDPNRQRQHSVQQTVNGLLSGEVISDTTEAEPRAFVLTLSTGRLVHVFLNDQQGKTTLDAQFMQSGPGPNSGIFGSLRGVFSGLHWKKDIASVKSAPSVRKGRRCVITATSHGTFQVWNLEWNHTHSLLSEIDARAHLLTTLEERQLLSLQEIEPDFTVIDFAVLSSRKSNHSTSNHKKEGSQPSQNENHELVLLTRMGGAKARGYALIHLSLSNTGVIVHLVRPITSFTASDSSSTTTPRLLIPQPEDVGYIIFEDGVAILSLEIGDPTPDAQLRAENRTLQEPYEDLVRFRQLSHFRVVGCSLTSSDRLDTASSCLVAVQDFGVIRLTAELSKRSHSDIDEATTTIQNKIEQAVFYRESQQGLIDFSPRSGESYAKEDVEEAALSISHSITASTSSHIPIVSPSLSQQIEYRVTALSALIDYLVRHHWPISQQVRWKLLWNAERLAAAQALWRWYNDSDSKNSSAQKELLANLIEAIPETLKEENNPQSGESDGVRHWFVHDAWRLEWVIPYAHEIVDLIFRESAEDKHEVDTVTQASMVAAAADIQLVTLQAAFKFRQTNAATYGFEKDNFDEGVLKSPALFKQLPEFWTSASLKDSTGLMVTRVKELADLTNANAKLLAGYVDDYCEQEEETQQEEDLEALLSVMNTLASKYPRQIEICSQVFVERHRWLQSREKAEERNKGDDMAQAFTQVRRQQICDLIDLNLSEDGIALAERYCDMEALLDILYHESAESNSIGPSIPGRVKSYFERFGSAWADAYFSRSLEDGNSAVTILSENADFKPFLTRFLRTHPEYANMAWINEISSERNYSSAAAYLNKAANQTDDVWTQKTMLSLSKLSVEAALAMKQSSEEDNRVAAQKSAHRQAFLQIQERLLEFLRPHVATAIDDEAAADVVIDHFGIRTVGDKPCLKSQLRRNLLKLFKREVLASAELISLLSLLHEDTVQPDGSRFLSRRFFLAFRVLQITCTLAGISLSSSSATFVATMIWRRVLIASDWTALNHTEMKDDAQVHRETFRTALFQTLLEGFQVKVGPQGVNLWTILTPPFSPKDILGANQDINRWHSLPAELQSLEEDAKLFVRDLSAEDDMLETFIKKGRLNEWYKGVLASAEIEAKNALLTESPRRPSKPSSSELKRQDRNSLNFSVHEDAYDDVNDGSEIEPESDGGVAFDS